MTPNKYEISSLTDFLTVPEDRLSACLDDFACWLAAQRRGNEYEAELAKLFAAVDAKVTLSRGFVWVDDGIPGISGLSVTVDVQYKKS